MSDSVRYERNGPVGYVTIHRPSALNALNEEVLLALEGTLDLLEQDGAVRAVILTGAGGRAFVAGADIAAMRDMTPEQARRFSRLGQRVFGMVEQLSKPVIAAIDGYALGGGCELAMACDIRVATPKSKLGIPEVTLGVFPSFGGTQRLPRLVGLGVAKELLATARKVPAEEARAMGLLNHVVPEEELMSFCEELAHTISQNSAPAVAWGKQCMNQGMEMDLDRALELESALFGLTFSTPDQKEGMGAFLEKRKPLFL